jgi:hypothetical protein
MTWLLAKLLGVDPSKFEGIPLSKLSIRFLGLPQSWWALLVIAALIVLVWLTFRTYKREGASASPAMKNFLAVMRFGAILLVLLGLFQPTLVIDQSKPLRSAAILLVDNSLSMGIQDKLADENAAAELAKHLEVAPQQLHQMSRMEIVRRLLERNRSETLHALAQQYDLKLFTFSDAVQEVPLRPPRPADSGTTSVSPLDQPIVIDLKNLREIGQSTNIELALRSAQTQTRGQPIAAVVVITDGQANAGDAVAAARNLQQKGIAVYTIGVGDPSPPRNIEVGNISAPNVAFKADDLAINAAVVTQGFAGKPLRVSLMESERAGEEGREVAFQEIVVAEDGKPHAVSLKFKPENIGVLNYRVKVPVQPGETIEQDNTASAVVRVVDQKAQVLVISGTPGKEFRYVKNFLIRDKTIAAHSWLQTADPEVTQDASDGLKPLTRLPYSEEDLFKYDVIVLIDPNPMFFNPEWGKLLKRFVGEHGGGLIYIAGLIHTEDVLGNEKLGIAELLPVEIGRLQLTFQMRLDRANEIPWRLDLTPQGLDSPILKLENDPDENRKLWDDMPGIFWSQPIRATKPGGIALMTHSDPRLRMKEGPMPVMATQFYGVGRTLFIGFDSTWRWRYIEHSKYFNQFWGQAVRYLSQGRLLGGRKRVLVFTDKDAYTVGQQVEVTVRMFEQDFETPMRRDEVSAEVKFEDGVTETIKLTPDISKEGDYKGSFPALKAGLVEITPKITDPSLVEKMANKVIHVTLPQLEYKETRMNEPLLQQVAQVSGGKYLRPAQFDELRRLLPDKKVMLVNETTEDLWDAPIVLALFCLLLFTEWILRKWKNMA